MSGSEYFRGTKEDEVRGWGKEDLMGHGLAMKETELLSELQLVEDN